MSCSKSTSSCSSSASAILSKPSLPGNLSSSVRNVSIWSLSKSVFTEMKTIVEAGAMSAPAGLEAPLLPLPPPQPTVTTARAVRSVAANARNLTRISLDARRRRSITHRWGDAP